ncbi:DUF1501 domain-containing protein [Rubrivirga sp. IMCC45206]|uniref:DUF1501 domain-containing protein n=1 Tax=Rubrivirga sp. IMCC45206 TaxID=3391614 RepID=UPI00398FDB77
MCDHSHDRAISLDHGAAHDHDHEAWSRRQFMSRLGLSAVGASLVGGVGAVPARALGRTSLLDAVGRAETDRVLVLVQLSGGNDGLNTVVPLTNDLYYNARPGIALRSQDTFSLDGDTGLHNALSGLQSRWGDGELAVVRAAGYPDASLSHFRSTDHWLTASDGTGDLPTTGWAGRTLALEAAGETEPPSSPPGLQIGTAAPLLFQGDGTGYGTALFDVDLFLQIAAGGEPFPTDGLPDTPAGAELGFVRTTANESFRYRDAIAEAAQAGRNDVAYPGGRFGAELAAVAQMIKGRLGTRVYLVSLGSFDTHANQLGSHANLLRQLGDGLASFFDDLGVTGDADRVLAMTFSEFGRRVEQNGSNGTDHGTSAPLFLAGPAVAGGLHGDAPDLGALDPAGNLRYTTDFRRVYASLLTGWFGLSADEAASVLGAAYEPLGLLASPVSTGTSPALALALDPVRPNPTRGLARVRYHVPGTSRARVSVYDVLGRRIAQLADGVHRGGAHEVIWDAGALPAGAYVLRLETPAGQRSQTATVVR